MTFIVGPSYRQGSGYKIRVDRLRNEAAKWSETRLLEINSVSTFLWTIFKLYSFPRSVVIFENVGVCAVLPFVLKKHTWVLDYHGSVYDASIKRLFWIRKRVLLMLETLIARRGQFIVVSEAFKRILCEAYTDKELRFIEVIPNIPEVHRPTVSHVESKKLRLCYVGGLQEWQKIPQMLRFVQGLSLYTDCPVELNVLTGQIEEFKRVIKQTLPSLNFKVEVSRVPREDVLNQVEQADFALMLREQNWINKVACPTKAIEYLRTSTPLIVSNHLGDISSVVEKYNKGVIVSEMWCNDENYKAVLGYHNKNDRRVVEIEDFSNQVYKRLRNVTC